MYKFLSSYRHLANISQSELAKLLGINQSAYSLKESGKGKFSVDEAILIYDYIIDKIDKEDIVPLQKMFKRFY